MGDRVYAVFCNEYDFDHGEALIGVFTTRGKAKTAIMRYWHCSAAIADSLVAEGACSVISVPIDELQLV